jgi:hypothetical protein
MDEVEIDRALRATLCADPSPEFVARVRTKIAEAPPRAMMAGWWKPAAAVASAAILGIAVGLPRQTSTAPVAAGLKPSATYAPSTTRGVPVVVVPTLKSGTTTKPAARSLTSIPSEPPLPEVIIAAKDVEALSQFVRDMNDLQFVASFDETPASAPWVVSDLTIAPIGSNGLDATLHNN